MSGEHHGASVHGSTVLACLVIWLALSIALFSLGPYGELTGLLNGPLLEETFGYTPQDVAARFEALGVQGRTLYRHFQVLDAANAVLMGVALALALSFSLTRLAGAGSVVRGLAVLPLLAAGLELLENALLFLALDAFPAPHAMVSVAGVVTRAKLVIGFGSLLLVVVSFIALAARWALRRMSPKH